MTGRTRDRVKSAGTNEAAMTETARATEILWLLVHGDDIGFDHGTRYEATTG